MSDIKAQGPSLERLPLPEFKLKNNVEVVNAVKSEESDVNISNPRAATGTLRTLEVDNNTIEKKTNAIERGVSSFALAGEDMETFGHIGSLAGFIDVYNEPKAPLMFPQTEDAIKSLNFSSASNDADVTASVTEYYQMVIRLMQKEITPDEYYAKMPYLIEKIKDFTLNETDWETLRDSVLRTQRYILHYMWEDMQKISRAMDDGFKQYQAQLNQWIADANAYYASDEFIPGGAVMLDHFGKGKGVFNNDTHQVQQNIKYLLDGMCVQMGATKPGFNISESAGRDQYPTNKQMVWIEELSI